MNMNRSEMESSLSRRAGQRIRITDNVYKIFEKLEANLPMVSWEIWLLNELLSMAPDARQQCPILESFRYETIMVSFEGGRTDTEYDWDDARSQPTVEVTTEGMNLPGTLLWQLRLQQPETLTGVFDRLLGPMPTGGVAVIYMNSTRENDNEESSHAPDDSSAEPPEITLGVDDILYLLFETLYAGSRITDIGIALLILGGRSESEMHLGKINRWFLDSYEGIGFEINDPIPQEQ